MADPTAGDGLLRWLVGGLVAGGIVLGVLVAVFELGHDDGRQQARTAATAIATTRSVTTSSSTGGAADRGKQLFASDGCAGCHSPDGSRSVGPTMKGLAGSRVQLTNGKSVRADDAYLAKAIVDPDAEIVNGYQKGTMSAAVASFGLSGHSQDVAALVAFIKTLH